MVKYAFCTLNLLLWIMTGWSQDSCKAFTSFRNLKLNKYQWCKEVAKVQPINNLHFSSQENECYFFIPHNKRSISYYLKMYVCLDYQDAIYLNASRIGLGIGFNKVLTKGKYWVVLAVNPQHNSESLDLKFDNTTGFFMPDSSAVNSRHYMYYAIDTSNMSNTPLTFAGMLKILSPFPSLQRQFVADKYNDEPMILLAYVQELNRYIAYFGDKKQQE